MNKRILSVIVFGAALLSVQAQDGKGGISPAMLGQIQQSYQGTPSDKALRNAIGNNDIRKLALNQENMQEIAIGEIRCSSCGIATRFEQTS